MKPARIFCESTVSKKVTSQRCEITCHTVFTYGHMKNSWASFSRRANVISNNRAGLSFVNWSYHIFSQWQGVSNAGFLLRHMLSGVSICLALRKNFAPPDIWSVGERCLLWESVEQHHIVRSWSSLLKELYDKPTSWERIRKKAKKSKKFKCKFRSNPYRMAVGDGAFVLPVSSLSSSCWEYRTTPAFFTRHC